jgi:hypothetical protein
MNKNVSDEQFIHDCIVTIMNDDPSKIIQVRELSEGMPIFGNETIYTAMSEEALELFRVNLEQFPELKTIDEMQVLDMLESTFERLGW